MKKLFILFILITLTGCSLKVKDPRGLHGAVLRDMRNNQEYMAIKKANGLYELCYKMSDGKYVLP